MSIGDYMVDFEFITSPKARKYFSFLKHLKKLKIRRKYLRKQKEKNQ